MKTPDVELLITALAEKIRPCISTNTALVGIYTGGAWLAEKIHQHLGKDIPLGFIDTTFYRDDFDRGGLRKTIKSPAIDFDIADRDIILIDDVLYTGRSVRAAINELFDFGRPASIKLAVLVDRNAQELPITAQFVGMTLHLPTTDHLELHQEADGRLKLHIVANTADVT